MNYYNEVLQNASAETDNANKVRKNINLLDDDIPKKLKLLPQDLKLLTLSECRSLSKYIRSLIINTVIKNGGHMASNLGVVELTLAIHRIFNSPDDKILWDVGHQSYTHKILTGRLDKFATLRQKEGISGFPKPQESIHDAFISGHSSNSISAACGIARAMKLQNNDENCVVAVVGDGAFTGGMIYEGLNNAGKSGDPIIILLNHNDMSISKNVGALAKYLSNIRSSSEYIDTKDMVGQILDSTPIVGTYLKKALRTSKNILKSALYHSTMFEELGFHYLGPVDGHNQAILEKTLMTAKRLRRPVVVHINTIKGKGYLPAEKNPGAFHGVSKPKNPTKCKQNVNKNDNNYCEKYSAVFGKALSEMADKDNRICAVTAAMKYGTGLNFFAKAHKDRFFDVGIAEQHAVTFGAGLAAQGMLPVVAIYSSFLQRAYDQILHDASISKLKMVLAIDRAGFVGEDGETHQGLFDIPFLTTIPGIPIYAPVGADELKICLQKALDYNGVAALRYPMGDAHNILLNDMSASWVLVRANEDFLTNSKTLIVSYGRTWEMLCEVYEQNNFNIDILKLTKIFPIDDDIISSIINYNNIIFFEECMNNGGIAEHLALKLLQNGFKGEFLTHNVNEFVKQASVEEQMDKYGLGFDVIKKNIEEVVNDSK